MQEPSTPSSLGGKVLEVPLAHTPSSPGKSVDGAVGSSEDDGCQFGSESDPFVAVPSVLSVREGALIGPGEDDPTKSIRREVHSLETVNITIPADLLNESLREVLAIGREVKRLQGLLSEVLLSSHIPFLLSWS